jgi:23S rRNA pseudouridine1911/1915/1917 synthase
MTEDTTPNATTPSNAARAATPLLLIVPADAAGQRLDAFLAREIEDLSRSRVHDLVAEGIVRVNGLAAKPSRTLQGGETIEALLPPSGEPLPEPEPIPLEVLYEDDDLLIVNKPAGLIVHPGAGVRSGTLVNAVLHHCPGLSGVGSPERPGIVHRLDRLTSGCTVVAKTQRAYRSLTAQIADRTMKRTYLAWVCGQMPSTEGTIDAPIGRSARVRTHMAVTKGGRPAVTHWRVVARAPGLTRLECRLETGRTHQIRVHLAHLRFPVVGDPEYGLSGREARSLIPPSYPTVVQAVSHARRQMLHARRLDLVHPVTGVAIACEAPLPDDFRAFDAAVGFSEEE